MPLIAPDTSQAIDMTPILPGTYRARVQEIGFELSKKGNPMVVVKFGVTVDDKVRSRNSYLVITGEGAGGFDQLLRSCHFVTEADAYRAGGKEPFDTDKLLGQELLVVIDTQQYEGSPRDFIKTFLAA